MIFQNLLGSPNVWNPSRSPRIIYIALFCLAEMPQCHCRLGPPPPILLLSRNVGGKLVLGCIESDFFYKWILILQKFAFLQCLLKHICTPRGVQIQQNVIQQLCICSRIPPPRFAVLCQLRHFSHRVWWAFLGMLWNCEDCSTRLWELFN